MAFVHGKGAYIMVNSVDFTPYSNEVGMPRDIDTAETSHFGTQSKTYITGMDDSTASISGLWDATMDAAVNTAMGDLSAGTVASIPIIYGPAGNGTGKVRFTFSAIIASYEVSASTGDVVSFSLELQRTGSTTVDTFA